MKKFSKNFQKIDEMLSELLRPMFDGSKREFLIINNLVKNWSQIVGSSHAKSCQPKFVQLHEQSKNGLDHSASMGKLTIVAFNSSTGFFLKNSAELIIERISSLYGFKAISKIIIKQEPRAFAHNEQFQKSAAIIANESLSEFSQNRISQAVAQVKNPELSEILSKLGSLIFVKAS